MTNQPSKHWKFIAQKIARSDRPVEFTKAQIEALTIIENHSKEIFYGTIGHTMSEKDILQICQILSRCPTAEKKERFNFITRGIEWGNKHLQWDIPLSPLFHSINRERTHLQPKIYLNQEKADRLTSAFLTTLESPCSESAKTQLGQILFSAVQFGGLLETKWYQPFLLAIIRQNYFQHGTWLWLDMHHVPKSKNRLPEQKRWVADPLTQLLILRYFRIGDKTIKRVPNPWKVIDSVLLSLTPPLLERPRILTELRNWGIARNLHFLPGSLLGYATGTLPSSSLLTEAWLRILTGDMIPKDKSDSKTKRNNKPKTQKIIENIESTTAKQLKLFKKARNKLTTPAGAKEMTKRLGKSRLKRFLRTHRTELGAPLQAFIIWSIRLLSPRTDIAERRQSAALKVRSVLRYWTEIGEILIRVFDDKSPVNLEPEQLEHIYEKIALRLGNSHYGIGRLAQFHAFLEVFYQAHEIEWGNLIDDEGQIISRVDANIISVATYEIILESLGWKNKQRTRWQTLYILATILAFRCGLRPGEIRALRAIDLQGVTQFEILVRRTGFKSPKSDAGIRRIPISILLPTDELEFLLKYWDARKKEGDHFGDGHLLAHPVRKSGMLSDQELHAHIRDIIRKVTKDQTLRFYHLRHSFVSWNHLAMHLHEEISHEGFSALTNHQFSHERIQLLKKSLNIDDEAAQKQQYVLAMLAGHASPKTSHKHYIHMQDWTLAYSFRHPTFSVELTYKAMMQITGLSRPQTFELRREAEQKKEHILLPFIRSQAKKLPHDLSHPLLSLRKKPQKTTIKTSASSLPDWATVVTKQNEYGINLEKLSTKDWTLAASVYENVRQMDGRRQKTAIRMANYALDNFSERWGGIVCKTIPEAERLLTFLKRCNIPKSNLLAIHHPRRGQTDDQITISAQKWREAIKLWPKHFAQGELSNKKELTSRGCITLKVMTSPIQPGKKRLPPSSPGFVIALKMLIKATQ